VAAGTSIAKTGSGISAVLQFDRALALEKGVDAAVHSIQASYLLLTNHGSEDRWIVEKMKTVIEAAERKDLNSESALSANPYAYLLRGLALLNLGQNEESDQDFKRFLESNYDTYTGALIIASKMLENLRFDAASLYFDTAVKNSGSAESALLNIMKTISDFKERRAGELSSDQRKTIGEMGINYVDKLMFYGPLEVYYVTLKSDMLDIMGRNRESADVFYEAAAMVPTASGLFNNLSYMWAKQGSNLDEALKLVHRAMALEPNQNVYYLDTEGWIYYMQGKYSKAIDKIQKTVWQMREESGSSLSESFYHLGMAQMKNRDIDMAVKSFATAVRLGFLTYYGKISFGELKKMGKAPDLKW
jgi:tetratricopeptide (TPR) repeat protein